MKPAVWCVTYDGEMTHNLFLGEGAAKDCLDRLNREYPAEEARRAVVALAPVAAAVQGDAAPVDAKPVDGVQPMNLIDLSWMPPPDYRITEGNKYLSAIIRNLLDRAEQHNIQKDSVSLSSYQGARMVLLEYIVGYGAHCVDHVRSDHPDSERDAARLDRELLYALRTLDALDRIEESHPIIGLDAAGGDL